VLGVRVAYHPDGPGRRPGRRVQQGLDAARRTIECQCFTGGRAAGHGQRVTDSRPPLRLPEQDPVEPLHESARVGQLAPFRQVRLVKQQLGQVAEAGVVALRRQSHQQGM